MSQSGATEPVKVDVGSEEIAIQWADGHETRFGLVDLRIRCTCAQCNELRERGSPIWPRPGVPEILRVENAELVGAWGLSLHWNDRHETGIYPWETLRAWCACSQCSQASEELRNLGEG